MKNQWFGVLTTAAVTLLLLSMIGITARGHNPIVADVRTLFSILITGVEALLCLWSLYQTVIAIAGLFPLQRAAASDDRPPRFLCLTAAHNEEKVIAEHIRSLQAMQYRKNRYDIVVLADNCTDRTPQIAKRQGAIVWERHNLYDRGKGHALQWALSTKANLRKYDAVCIFDADNLVDGEFLNGMARHLRQGHVAIQGYLDTKNPWDSWITAAYASAYWFMNRLWQHARMVLGLSGALGGTGFCIATSILRQVPWEATSLTEDLEYTVRLILRGYRVKWTSEARVFDEKPVRFDATVPQRRRWMQGHWTTAFRYSKALLQSVAVGKPGSIRSNLKFRMRTLDMLIYLWQPAFVLLMGLNLVFSLGEWCFGWAWFHPLLTKLLPPSGWTALGIIGFSLPLIAFGLERAGWKAVLYYPTYLLFNLTWIPVTIEALRNLQSTAWVHTEHHRSLNLQEVNRVRRL